jgi:predicted ester cyclase
MSTHGNLILTRRFINECWNQGKVDVLDEIMASDHIHHLPDAELHGSERIKRLILTMRTAFPDLHTIIEDEIVGEDKVVMRVLMCGTNLGEFFGDPPPGNSIAITGIDIIRCANGRIVELWSQPDSAGLDRQLNKKL